jgi:hypothetical protein
MLSPERFRSADCFHYAAITRFYAITHFHAIIFAIFAMTMPIIFTSPTPDLLRFRHDCRPPTRRLHFFILRRRFAFRM